MKWGLDDPDNIGQSEYRAIVEVLEDAMEEDDYELADLICDEFISWAQHIQQGIRRARYDSLPYSVGHVKDKTVRTTRHATLEEAEGRIAALLLRDPEGVDRGDYFLDGPPDDDEGAEPLIGYMATQDDPD